MMRGTIVATLMVMAVASAAADAVLGQTSLLYGLADAASNGRRNADSCDGQLDALKRGIDQRDLWALKMLDSSAVPGSGFLWGNNYWLGSRSQCLDAVNRMPLVLANSSAVEPSSTPPFSVRFLAVELRVNSSQQVHVGLPNEDLVIAGLCLPRACSTWDVAQLMESLLLSRPLHFQQLYSTDLRLEQVRTLEEDNVWLMQPKFLVVAVLIGAVLLLMVAGTLYDVAVWQPHLKRPNEHLNNYKKNKEHVEVTMTNNMKGAIAKLELVKLKSSDPERKKNESQQGALGRFLVCFSIYTNTGILLDTSLGTDSVGAVHGLRFMGMGWILMVHTIFYLSDFADNKPLAFRLSEGFLVQVVSNSTLSVDTFFFLSGFLVAYMFYIAKKGKQDSPPSLTSQVQEFGLMVLRRFLRLTPAYMAVLGITVINMTWYSNTSLFHMTERADVVCSQYWWRNILYINNLFGRDQMCMSWSWYLSNDMQFFTIAAFLLILSTTPEEDLLQYPVFSILKKVLLRAESSISLVCFTLSAAILVALVVSSSLLTGYISYNHGYFPTLDQQLAMLEILYDPPWTRIGPHLVGVATGYLVVRLDGKLPLSKCSVTLAWLLGASCNVTALFGLYERTISPLAAALYVALSRTAWGVGLAWIIIACCTNNAGIINSTLSFRGWVPLSRLTYCAYLINPMLITSVYLSGETAIHVHFLPLATLFLGHLGICYFCAYAVSLAFETPNVLLMRWLVGKRSLT